MKLRYKVPHKVTARMVGVQFVATCSCKKWSQQTDPRKYDKVPGGFDLGWFKGPNAFLDPIGDLISASHKHATDHVLEAHQLTRKVAA